MKRFLAVFMFASVSLMFATHDTKRHVDKMVQPYKKAIDFVIEVDPSHQINDHDVFIFFNKNALYQTKDVTKFNNVVRAVKKMTYTKKSLRVHRDKLEALIENLVKIQKFIVAHATTYYALITYYEIAARYYYIDECMDSIVNLMMQQSEKLGLRSMQGRGLYKFGKTIDVDLRRLTALFAQNIVSDDLIVKMNQIKIKLITLKTKIMVSSEYKSQLSKTRWLKALGVCILPTLIILPFACFPLLFFQPPYLEYIAIGYAFVYLWGSLIVTIDELSESSKYNIPVHSASLFSWFMPIFLPLTWIPRG